MTKQKQSIEVQSLKAKNMNNIIYMKLHRRMYTVSSPFFDADVGTDSVRYDLVLRTSINKSSIVSIGLTESAFNDFNRYETDVDLLINYFSALCIKLGHMDFYTTHHEDF